MRRTLVALAVFSSFALLGCEDGPTQTFSAAPDGAGSKWNDGNTPPASDPSKQGFTNGGGQGENKQEICSGEEKAKRWAQIVKAPIVPPTQGGGIDTAGWDAANQVETWQGLTIDQAEHRPVDAKGNFNPMSTDFNVGNCQSVNDGDQFGDGSQVNSWGDNAEIWVDYRVSTRKIQFMTFWPGYIGTVDAKSRDGAHTFTFPVSTRVSKDGQPYTINWAFPADANFTAQLNEMYDALIATYAPALPQADNCVSSGACITGNFGDVAYIYIPALGLGFWVDNFHAAQPVPSTFNRVDMYLAKTLGFSLGNPLMKLDAEGPVANLGKIGTGQAACDLKLGVPYSDFLADCVQTTGDAKKDAVELAKLTGGLAHSTERFSFDVQGIDLNFSAKSLPDDKVLGDKDVPQPTDIATEFDLDQSTLGRVLNDRQNMDGTGPRDNHGAGLVYIEYARLVQEKLQQYLPQNNVHALGASECTMDVANGADYADGCTGFEGFTTCAAPTGDPNLDLLSVGYPGCAYLGLALGLKPGHTPAAFCLDTTGDINTGYSVCQTGDLFSTSFARVLSVLGKGKVTNLPVEVQDVRFFWKQYVTALIKYFMVAGSANETPAGVHAQFVDPDQLFFDSVGAGQFEIAEYIDRRFASKTQDPTDVSISADVKNGIFNSYTFSREIYRGESAIYQSVLENQADGVGQENTALLTNVFGSPILKNGWTDSSAGKSAYYCATNLDPQNCDGQLPPLDVHGNLLLDEAGQPLLAPYPGAFGSSSTAFTLGATKITVNNTYPNIQQALITVPLHKDPYDAKSKALNPLHVLIPWLVKQPGVGFPVPLNGELEKFIETYQLDFSGTTISANVDYDLDPTDPSGTRLQLLAVETTDFLGNVFVCQDPNTKDLLSVEMYSPVANILDWIANHPGAYDSCGLIIRYSPYGNYADYITSLTNGVRLGITQGGGYGRVVDVTLFVPGQ
jgi:hypothetical protein